MATQDDAQAVVRHVAVVVAVVPMTFVMPVIAGIRCAMPVVVPMVPMLRPVPAMVVAPGVMATVSTALFPLLTVVITTCLVPCPGMDAILTPVLVVIMTLLAVLGTRSVVAAAFPGTGERNRIIAGEEKSDQ